MGWLGFGLENFPLAPFSILFLIDEWRRGTSGGAWLFARITGVGGARTWLWELNRCGGNGGADESVASMLLMLFDDPELGKRRGAERFCSLLDRFKAFVDLAWLLVRLVPGWRLGTGGGGGLLVGLCALGFCIGACKFNASWIFCWLIEFMRIVPKWLSELKGPEGDIATGGDLKSENKISSLMRRLKHEVYLGDFIDWWRATTFLLLSPFKLLLLPLPLPLVTSLSRGGGLGAKFGFPWLITFGGLRTVDGPTPTIGLLNSDDLFAIASDMLGDDGEGVWWAEMTLKYSSTLKWLQAYKSSSIKSFAFTYLCFDLISFTNELDDAGGVV